MSLAPSQRAQVQTFLGGGRALPNINQVLREQQVQQFETQRRRSQQQQQAQRSRTARRESTRQAQASRDQRRDEVGGLAIKFAMDKLGKRQGNNYAERVRRAIRLNQNIPLPPAGEGREAFLQDFANQGLTGTTLRKIGFDVPRGDKVVDPTDTPQTTSPTGGGERFKTGGVIPDPDRGARDRLFRGEITKDEFAELSAKERTFNQPSGRFEVDRVAQGNNIQDVIERRSRGPTTQPEPEPEPQSEQDIPLIDRRKTGGASGGIQGLTTEQQFDELVSSRGQTNPFGNVGLAQQRSVPTGIGSGLTEAQKQRDRELIAQLEAEPRSSPRGRGGANPLKRAGTI